MVSRLVEGFDPLRIILFGSRATGTARWDSDYDFLVVMPDGVDYHKTVGAMLRALADMPASKDILLTTPGEILRRGSVPGVLKNALSEGVTVYERT
jgi:predicted nucleotidyltransferase